MLPRSGLEGGEGVGQPLPDLGGRYRRAAMVVQQLAHDVREAHKGSRPRCDHRDRCERGWLGYGSRAQRGSPTASRVLSLGETSPRVVRQDLECDRAIWNRPGDSSAGTLNTSQRSTCADTN